MKMLVSIAITATLMAGCITGDGIRNLSPGMTRAEVIQTVGRPDGVQTSGEYESLSYANRLMSGWSWDRTDYFVILKNGVVTQYGNGAVRQEGPPGNTVLVLVNPFTH